MAQHQRGVTVSKDCKVKCQGDMVVDKNLGHKDIDKDWTTLVYMNLSMNNCKNYNKKMC